MSRLIVKNLPKTISEDKLRNLFGQKGTITDIQLKYTKEGVFRQFAFIGYLNEEQAKSALQYFNNSCIQTNRIKVETCAPLGDESKPKAWSKYSKESSTYKKIHGIDTDESKTNKKVSDHDLELKKNQRKKNLIEEIIGDYKNDPEFQEFMQVHSQNRTLWDNDAALINESTESVNDDDDNKKSEVNVSEKLTSINTVKNKTNDNLKKEKNEKEGENFGHETAKSISKKAIDLYTIKIHNLPYQVKRSDITKFFKPIKPYSIRLPTKVHGFCYVGFKTEKEFQKAMLKDKSFIKKKQIFFSDFTERNKITKAKKELANGISTSESNLEQETGKNPKWSKQEENIKNEEDISESGKIFFRNLSYITTEDELQKIFEKYGPTAEINLPIDPITRQIKGFGTVTFVMPEHAVQAFNELDGSMFQGRLLHLIPGKSKDKEEENLDENSLGYKAKKNLEMKKSANSSHNWNSLFLGANAVADVLSKRLETTKEALFDTEKSGFSAAVRLALGETEIVIEMKKFLEENGVQLDVFNSVPKKRSKTIILAKNLPAETTISELRPMFAKFGPIGRLLLPPSGVTAIIEYLDSSEAKKAFKKLAYSKFKNLPLYLEWAPENTFKPEVKLDNNAVNEKEKSNLEEIVKNDELSQKKSKKDRKICNLENNENDKINENDNINENAVEAVESKKDDNENLNDDDNEEPEPETTLFLRNLNFKTREGAIREHFKNLGAIHIIQVATKKDPNDARNKIPLGYGFIQFKKRETALKALKQMQFTKIEGNQVELKRSDRILSTQVKSKSNKSLLAQQSKQTGSKILVKNIPFQAKPKEVEDIFKTFGELRSIRLPKKMTPGENTHRGFGFVDFITKSDAKRAFEALCQSTHLYGRRLILEWAAVDDTNVDELRKRTAEHFTDGNRASINAKRSRKAVFDTTKIVDTTTGGNIGQEDNE